VKKFIIVFVALFAGLSLVLFIKALPSKVEDNLGSVPFALKKDLPFTDQEEIDRLVSIPVAQRTASESAWLATREQYQYNAVIQENDDGYIVEAQGNTLPSGTSGFLKGATFHLLNADYSLRGLYENTGDETTSVWKAVGLQSVSVTLASASLDTINATPIQVIADPGDGKVIELVAITGYRYFSSDSWHGILDGLEVKYDGATGVALTASFSTGFITGNGSSSTASPSYQTRYAIDVNKASPSEAVYFTSGSNPTIDGDTYFKFDVLYRIVELP
jgi:hypothetical protein